mmetsp:Transcript_21449/g.50455  ORF Transcript_21449/g.50455 Transcript_21449/m.50455 type:complete len:253 (+) Transcript_21449:45-803(+)
MAFTSASSKPEFYVSADDFKADFDLLMTPPTVRNPERHQGSHIQSGDFKADFLPPLSARPEKYALHSPRIACSDHSKLSPNLSPRRWTKPRPPPIDQPPIDQSSSMFSWDEVNTSPANGHIYGRLSPINRDIRQKHRETKLDAVQPSSSPIGRDEACAFCLLQGLGTDTLGTLELLSLEMGKVTPCCLCGGPGLGGMSQSSGSQVEIPWWMPSDSPKSSGCPSCDHTSTGSSCRSDRKSLRQELESLWTSDS